MTRKQFITISISIVCCLALMAPSALAEMQGQVTVFKHEEATVHSYMAPAKGGFVNSQIIETKNGVVIVDAQFIRPFAKEVAAYVKGLKKPIKRVIVTHVHPDHWFGLEFYKDVPIYALPEVSALIEKLGDMFIKNKKSKMGDLITDKKVVPQHAIKEGTEVIDGVTFEFIKFGAAEASVQLAVKLPELKTLIAQDLVYNGVHLFLGQNAFDGWIDVMKTLKADKDIKTVLAGHGKPADPSVYDKMITYLEDAKNIFATAKNGEEFKQGLMKKYPDYKGPFLLDISIGMLYKKK